MHMRRLSNDIVNGICYVIACQQQAEIIFRLLSQFIFEGGKPQQSACRKSIIAAGP